jgi:hypothetical protein
MLLSDLGKLLKSRFKAKQPFHNAENVDWLDSVLGPALSPALGNTPEAANQAAIVRHCAEVAKSADNSGEIAPSELISTMLGYFMVCTLAPGTSGLLYSGELHPISRLVRDNRNVVAVDGESIAAADLGSFENNFSAAIIIVTSRKTELEFYDHLLASLTAGIDAIGINVLVSAERPERAAAVANAICAQRDYRAINFPVVQSRLGLTGICLRCVS